MGTVHRHCWFCHGRDYHVIASFFIGTVFANTPGYAETGIPGAVFSATLSASSVCFISFRFSICSGFQQKHLRAIPSLNQSGLELPALRTSKPTTNLSGLCSQLCWSFTDFAILGGALAGAGIVLRLVRTLTRGTINSQPIRNPSNSNTRKALKDPESGSASQNICHCILK